MQPNHATSGRYEVVLCCEDSTREPWLSCDSPVMIFTVVAVVMVGEQTAHS